MKIINVYYSDYSTIKGLKQVMELVLSGRIKIFTVTRVCNNFMEVYFNKDHHNPYFQAEHFNETNCILI